MRNEPRLTTHQTIILIVEFLAGVPGSFSNFLGRAAARIAGAYGQIETYKFGLTIIWRHRILQNLKADVHASNGLRPCLFPYVNRSDPSWK